MPIIGRKPPASTARINRSHPIGGRIVRCILHNTPVAMPVELVTGKVLPWATPASVSLVVGADGNFAHEITSDSLDQRIYMSTGHNSFDNVWMRWIVTPSVVADLDMLYRSGATGSSGSYLYLGSSKVKSELATSATSLSTGTRYDILIIYNRAPNTCDLYINGELDTAGFAHASDANAFTIWGDSFSQNIRGVVEMFQMGLGMLSPGQVRQMYLRPYAFLETDDNYDSDVPTSPPPPTSKLFRPANYDGLGGGGPFFADPLAAFPEVR